MTGYGYLDMPDHYSDVADDWVRAMCLICGRWCEAIREDCKQGDGELVIDDCGCSMFKECVHDWLDKRDD